MGACGQQPAGDAGQPGGAHFLLAEGSGGTDCTLAAAWEPTLALGLRRDSESAQRLATLKSRKECALEIRKLAEVLLDDRVVEHQHPETAAKVRFQGPDLRPLHLKKQPSQPIAVEVAIDAQGRVAHAQLLQAHSDPRINELFLAEARGWLFRPARQGEAYVASKQSFSANVHVR